jgi:putative membrane protein
MSNDSMRFPAITMTLVLALAAGACQGKARAPGGTESGNNPAVSDTASPTGADTSMSMGKTSDSTAAKGGLDDAAILGLLDNANKADSTGGALAVKKATNPDVKAFGQMMMSEHHALRVSGEALAKKLGVTPKAPAKDPIAPYAAAEMNALQKASKKDFDKTYIDNEVTVHQAVIDAANQAKASTSTPELKDLLQQALPVIQKHLDQAQSLQKKLAPTA